MRRNLSRKSVSVTTIRHLLTKSSRQFWFLQICGWTGYFALNYTTMLADGKPWHYVYYSACIAFIGLLVTSVLRLGYQRLWNLPALTYRDANAMDLQDFLDLHRPAFATPPTLAAAQAPDPTSCHAPS